MQFRDYLAVARRSWVVILACAIIGTAVGGMVALTTPTSYRATTDLWVSVNNTGRASDLALSTSFARQAVVSYVQIVPTSIVLDPVIDELDLADTTAVLAERVSASAPLNSQVISITVTATDPSEASQIANAVAASFSTVVSEELERPVGEATASKVTIETLAAATVPTEPSAPNLRLNLLLGLLVGVGVGVGLAVLRFILDTRVHTIADVEQVVPAPILGGITFDPDAGTRPLIVQAAPRDPRAEAFRRLRTNLQFLELGGHTPMFVITSSAPAEGKSTTAANIALTLAETGARVALVDADLRKPRVADLFGLEGGVGLSDVLAGRVSLSDVVQRWSFGKLFIIPAGTLPPNPAELLGSRAMDRTLGELGAAFDYVVVDTPPLLAVTDAAVLARKTTGAILIVASGSSRRPQLEASVRALATADATLLGAVITKLPTKGPDSQGYGQYTYGVTHTNA